MTLEQYRREKGWTYAQLANALGASHPTIARRWCLRHGDKQRLIPSPKYMERIMLQTASAVMPNDFYVRHEV
jgi:transcriptional regulator with XRE-family HTH domain